MYIMNNTLNTINCEECSKKDVCKFSGEFQFAVDKVKEMNKDYDVRSPIKISVSCTSAIKNINTREEYQSQWIKDLSTGNVGEMK